MSYQPRFPILIKLGLSDGEAEIFELLVESGTQKARDLVEGSTQGRGNVYNLLNSLIAKGLVLEISGTQKLYQAVDPTRLKTLLNKKKEETHRLEHEFSESLGTLSSLFTLSTGRPTIQIFEGMNGFEQALNDSLSAKGEILTYFDPDAVIDEFAEINKKYVAKRIKRGIEKRIIVPNTTSTRMFFKKQNTPYTKVAFVRGFPSGFESAIEIYNDHVTYLTMTKEKQIGVTINDHAIFEMQRLQFEFIWARADEVIDYTVPTSSDFASGNDSPTT